MVGIRWRSCLPTANEVQAMQAILALGAQPAAFHYSFLWLSGYQLKKLRLREDSTTVTTAHPFCMARAWPAGRWQAGPCSRP